MSKISFFLVPFFYSIWILIGLSPAQAQVRLGVRAETSDILIFGYGAGTGTVERSKIKRDLNGEPRFTPPSQWGYDRDVTYCLVMNDYKNPEKNTEVNLLLKKYLENRIEGFKNHVTVSNCRVGVDIFIIDGDNYNKIFIDGINSGNYKNTIWAPLIESFFIQRQYGVLLEFGGDPFAKIMESVSAKNKADAQSEKQDELDLVKLASLDSKDKVYLLQFGTLGAQRMCALKTSSDDALPIRALAKITGDQRQKGRVSFYATYSTLEDFWKSFYFSSGRVVSTSGYPCDAFIDFAKNTKVLSDAFLAARIPTRVSGYGSLSVSALALGYKSINDYTEAQAIGAQSRQFYDLGDYGISSYDRYLAIVKEMHASSYSSSYDVEDVLSYAADKREGARLGISAARVRTNRDRSVAAQELASEAAFARCLSSKGYYQTSNAAAKRAIRRQC